MTRERPSRSGCSRAIRTAVGASKSAASGKTCLFNVILSSHNGSMNSRWTFRASDYYNRRTKAAHGRVGFEKLSADFQRIGRKQIVSTRIMFRIDRLGRDEGVSALICQNGDRMPPRLNICSIDVLNDTRYSEVIDPSSRFVFWMSFQYTIRDSCSQQVMF